MNTSHVASTGCPEVLHSSMRVSDSKIFTVPSLGVARSCTRFVYFYTLCQIIREHMSVVIMGEDDQGTPFWGERLLPGTFRL